MENPCQQLNTELEVLKHKAAEFDVAYEEAIKSGDAKVVEKLQREIDGQKVELEKKLDPYLVTLRANIAKKFGADRIRKFNDGVAVMLVGQKAFYVNTNGEIISNPDWDCKDDFSEGFGIVSVTENMQRRHAFMDADGKILGNKWYDDAESFNEGRAIVAEENDGHPTYFFIDKKGNRVGTEKYRSLSLCKEGIAIASFSVGSARLDFYIDADGNKLFGRNFKDAGEFSDGIACVREVVSPGRSFYINKKGEVLFNDSKYEAAGSFKGGLAPVKINNKWRVMDTAGHVHPGIFEGGIRILGHNLVAEKTANGFYLKDIRGNHVRASAFEDICEFHEDRARVVVSQLPKDTCFYIDKRGERVSGVYESGDSFSQGYARVKKDGQYFYINKGGALAFGGESFEFAENFHDGMALVVKDSKKCWINLRGQKFFE